MFISVHILVKHTNPVHAIVILFNLQKIMFYGPVIFDRHSIIGFLTAQVGEKSTGNQDPLNLKKPRIKNIAQILRRFDY